MRSRRLRVLLIVGILGALSITIGWILESSGFPSSLLLEIGAGALLFTVLYAVERSLIDQIETVRVESAEAIQAVEDRIEEVDTRVTQALDELQASTRQVLAARDEAIDGALDALSEDASWETVDAILRVGHSIDAVDPSGPRVQIPGMWQRVRFQRASTDGTPIILLRIEELDGVVVAIVVWKEDQGTADIFAKLIGELQKAGLYQQEVDPAALLEGLRVTVRAAVDARRHRVGPYDLGKVIEIPTPQWAVTLDGMECLETYYPISPEQLGDVDLPRHMSEKAWCNMDDFWDALPAAKALHGIGS